MSSSTVEPTTPVDATLAILVRRVSESNVAIPITLVVGGVRLSGHLISAHDYVKDIGNAGAREIRDEFSRLHRERCRPSYEAKARVEAEEMADAAAYFHLREPDVEGGPGRLWRGRLAAVDAFAQTISFKST